MGIDTPSEDSVSITHTRISAAFEITEIDIVLSVEIQGQERKFANIRLQEFMLAYNNFAKPITELTVNLGELRVEDLLHDGDPSYRYPLKSSDNERRNKGHNLSMTSRLSSSCPEGSSLFDQRILSTSLPSVLNYSPKKYFPHAISPLRPMMHNQKKFPSQPQLHSTREICSEDECEVEHFLSKEEREESWVKIKILLIDEEVRDRLEKEVFVSMNSYSGGQARRQKSHPYGIFSIYVRSFLKI